MKLIALFEQYSRKHLRGKSANTTRLYHHTIRSFARFLRREPELSDLDSDVIQDFIWKVVESGRSIATANKDRSQLVSLWNYAAKQRLVEKYPDVPRIAEPERVPMAWLPHELDALLRAARQASEPVGAIPGPIYWTAKILIILDTGERIGAVRNLPRNALHHDHLLVPASVRKGKTREKLYKLSPQTIQAIQRLQAAHSEPLLFPFPYGETYLYKRYQRLLKSAGLPIGRQCNFHRLRKTVCSAVARAGGDATAALDHARPETTKKYLDPRIVGSVDVSNILREYLADPTLRKSQQPPDRRDSA